MDDNEGEHEEDNEELRNAIITPDERESKTSSVIYWHRFLSVFMWLEILSQQQYFLVPATK